MQSTVQSTMKSQGFAPRRSFDSPDGTSDHPYKVLVSTEQLFLNYISHNCDKQSNNGKSTAAHSNPVPLGAVVFDECRTVAADIRTKVTSCDGSDLIALTAPFSRSEIPRNKRSK